MGSFVPTAAMGILQLGVDMAQQKRKVDYQQQQAELEKAAREAQARSRIDEIRQSVASEEQARQRALKRSLAAQRARFGAQGLGAGGSASAVLGGLAAEAQRDDQSARNQARLRIDQIRGDVGWSNRKSLLDTAQNRTQASFGMLQQGLRKVPLLPF